MSIKVYLNFNGNCREAVEYYAKVFKTEEPRIMSFGDMPSEQGPPLTNETKNLVLHAEIKIKDSIIMFSDTLPGMDFIIGNNITLIFNSSDMDEIKSIYSQLVAEGSIVMELQKTFWSECYGSLIDKFGIGWQLSYEVRR